MQGPNCLVFLYTHMYTAILMACFVIHILKKSSKDENPSKYVCLTGIRVFAKKKND